MGLEVKNQRTPAGAAIPGQALGSAFLLLEARSAQRCPVGCPQGQLEACWDVGSDTPRVGTFPRQENSTFQKSKLLLQRAVTA